MSIARYLMLYLFQEDCSPKATKVLTMISSYIEMTGR